MKTQSIRVIKRFRNAETYVLTLAVNGETVIPVFNNDTLPDKWVDAIREEPAFGGGVYVRSGGLSPTDVEIAFAGYKLILNPKMEDLLHEVEIAHVVDSFYFLEVANVRNPG